MESENNSNLLFCRIFLARTGFCFAKKSSWFEGLQKGACGEMRRAKLQQAKNKPRRRLHPLRQPL
jgi:hypothetical protein